MQLGVSLPICGLLMVVGCFITAFVSIKRNRMLVEFLNAIQLEILYEFNLMQCIFNESIDNAQANITSTSQEF